MAGITRQRIGELMRGVLVILAERQEGRHFREAFEILRQRFAPTDFENSKTSKGADRFNTYVGFNSIGLVKAGWITKVDGTWSATEAGRQALSEYPDASSFSDEMWRRYDAWADSRPTGAEDHDTEDDDEPASSSDDDRTASRAAARAARRRDPEAVRELVDELYLRLDDRRPVIDFLAEAIQKADALSNEAWGTTLRSTKIHLSVGRVLAVGLRENSLAVSLLVSEMNQQDVDALERAGAVREEFKVVPGAALFYIPPATVTQLRPLIEPAFDAFLVRAVRTSRVFLYQEAHSPGVLRYLEAELGRTLPRPGFAPSDDEDSPAPPRRAAKVVAFSQPRVQFSDKRQDLDGLLKLIDLGDIALPSIQRPFVWKASQVRDLFDSMFKGFPVGTLMLWETPTDGKARNIGLDSKQRQASRLVVDGQQRLTSLYAVMLGKPVLDESFEESHLEIAFRPLDGSFEVADAAIRKDPEYIRDISKLWSSSKATHRVAKEFVENLKTRRSLTPQDEDVVDSNLDRLLDLTKYPFTILEIQGDVDEEAVADIFVRINNGGTKLTQADFVLTLLSVFSPETRRSLEDFSRRAFEPATGRAASPFNHLIQPTADQLLRVAVAVGFRRARLSAVYQLLRGKDPSTGDVSPELRERHFEALKTATTEVLNLGPWHLFLGYLVGTGFRSADLISSESAVLYSYALYLLGRQHGVDERALARLMSRWFFVASISARYSGSSETVMEEDLNRLRNIKDATGFVEALESMLVSSATNDFWEITVPHDLETSSSTSPVARAFVAAQIKLGAPVLFSDRRISDAYDPAIRSHRKPLEAHHLFPKAWLATNNVLDTRLVNQAANFAHIEWPDNAQVSDTGPQEYVPEIRSKFGTTQWAEMTMLHALPPDWERMAYVDFLKARRKLMAKVIKRGYDALSSGEHAPQ